MRQYYVAEPGKSPQGPYAEAMVKSAYEQGMYPPGTKVWWEGATQWEQVELVFGKGAPDAVSPSLPPPLPPVPVMPPVPVASLKRKRAVLLLVPLRTLQGNGGVVESGGFASLEAGF